jgi:hypothetical protein
VLGGQDRFNDLEHKRVSTMAMGVVRRTGVTWLFIMLSQPRPVGSTPRFLMVDLIVGATLIERH